MLTLRSLYKELRLHLEVSPENQDKILDYVRNNCGPKLPPLRKGTRWVKDAREWYELLRQNGKGRKILSSDDAGTRSLGFHIFDKFKNGNDKCGETLMVHLGHFKEGLPTKTKKLFATPGKRAEFCKKLTEGKAPRLPKAS